MKESKMYITLDDELHSALKSVAKAEQRTMSAEVRVLLTEILKQKRILEDK